MVSIGIFKSISCELLYNEAKFLLTREGCSGALMELMYTCKDLEGRKFLLTREGCYGILKIVKEELLKQEAIK